MSNTEYIFSDVMYVAFGHGLHRLTKKFKRILKNQTVFAAFDMDFTDWR